MSSNDMNLSVNGHSQVPPGFRFHPTEEELLRYYLRKKVASEKIDLDVIRDVDLNKLEPWDIQERCKIGSTPQNDWYFFSHKDKKYPTGTRTNRATAAGFWKATGRDKVIYSSSRRIGMRKTLVFYMGRAPHGQKSDWIMHEYRLDDHNIHNDNSNHDHASSSSQMLGESMQEDGWVVCRVFTKKNYQRATESPKLSYRPPNHQMQVQRDSNPVLDQILVYMGKNCKQENNDHTRLLDGNMMQFLHPDTQLNEEMQMRDKFLHLPRLDGSPASYRSMNDDQMSDWVALDRLVASQLNGCGGDGGHLSDMIFDQTTSRQATCCMISSDINPNNMAAAGGGFDFSEEHNDAGEPAASSLLLPAASSLLLPELPLNHFNRSLLSTNQESSQHGYCSEVVDLWTFSSNHGSSSNSSSDPLGQLSV